MQIQITILQNQRCVQSRTKELNNIVSTQDLVSDITKDASVVIIESENHNQIACPKKDQGRSTHAHKSVKGSSNCFPSQNTPTNKAQNIDRKPPESCKKDIKLKSCANKSKFQHEWIHRLPLIESSRIRPLKKQPRPAKNFKHCWRTTNCHAQDAKPNVTSRSCDRENHFYNHPCKKILLCWGKGNINDDRRIIEEVVIAYLFTIPRDKSIQSDIQNETFPIKVRLTTRGQRFMGGLPTANQQ